MMVETFQINPDQKVLYSALIMDNFTESPIIEADVHCDGVHVCSKFKSLLIDFHNAWKELEVCGYLEGRKNL